MTCWKSFTRFLSKLFCCCCNFGDSRDNTVYLIPEPQEARTYMIPIKDTTIEM